ncbi:uncharacterized protein [Danio rerio]|uniref:Uncharacterized protein n=1 Tax=Danio rerio TaxID=7955 RepID=A0AC58I6Z7_DANRE
MNLSEQIHHLLHRCRRGSHHQKSLIKWFIKKRLLHGAPTCRVCRKEMKLTSYKSSDGYIWLCRRKGHRKVSSSVRKGSLFSQSRVHLIKWLEFIYRFAQGLQLRQIDMLEDKIASSSRTLSRMTNAIRKICVAALQRLRRRTGLRMGGKSRRKFISIDESKFAHKRKYNRGRFRSTWRRNSWVFGMLEIKGHRRLPVLKIVKNRSRQTLVPIIRRHARRGSTIFSDCWRAYAQALPRHGYRHFTVNHSENFVNPYTGCHTQHIERAWQSIKSQVNKQRGNKSKQLLKEHLKCIQWYQWLGKQNKAGVLAQLFHDIRKHFKIC